MCSEISLPLKLLLPFVVVIIDEVATIAFLGIGIGHEPIPFQPDKQETPRSNETRSEGRFRIRYGRDLAIAEAKAAFPAMRRSTAWSYAKVS